MYEVKKDSIYNLHSRYSKNITTVKVLETVATDVEEVFVYCIHTSGKYLGETEEFFIYRFCKDAPQYSKSVRYFTPVSIEDEEEIL